MNVTAQGVQITAGERRGNVRWVVIFWMFIIAAVSYLDRNNISIAASLIQQEFGLTNLQLGGVFSAFVMGYAFTQPIAGRIADRFGPYKVITVALVWWSLLTALLPHIPVGLGHSILLLMVMRFALGVGEAVIFPASNRLVANWIPSSERGLANGLIFAGVGVGGGVAPPLITYVMITYGWREAFYVSAAIGVVTCVVWLVMVRDRPRQHRAITEAEIAYIEAGLPASASKSRPAKWLEIIGDRQVLLLTASYFTYGYVAYIFFTWFFKYLSGVRGLDLKSSALYGMLPFIAMTVCSALGGMLSDRLVVSHGKRVGRCGVAGFGLLLASVFVAAATQVADARLASLVLAGGAGALYLAQSAYWALSADIGGKSAGSVSGLINMGCQIGGVITASLTPVIADAFGWTASFLVAAALCFVGGLLWLLIDPSHTLRLKGETPTAS
jgi:ACS family glucarate transporter-like MFS transporter